MMRQMRPSNFVLGARPDFYFTANKGFPSQEDLETQKRKTASAIVTSGALTLVFRGFFFYILYFLMF